MPLTSHDRSATLLELGCSTMPNMIETGRTQILRVCVTIFMQRLDGHSVRVQGFAGCRYSWHRGDEFWTGSCVCIMDYSIPTKTTGRD